MNYENLKAGLSSFEDSKVMVFLTYLKDLETAKNKDGQIVNPWFKFFTEQQAIEVYSKVAMDNLYIDGVSITIGYRGKILISYNYQAYKNKLLNVYPESKFDIQLVKDGDVFSFKKESRKVVYNHEIKNPFDATKAIIGVYCVISNSRGEFLETLDMEEIKKMRNVAKAKNIWNDWFGEMVIKSVIKRSCKRHFNDLVVNIDSLDNENYELENASVDSDIQVKIQDSKTLEQLTIIYNSADKDTKNNKEFTRLLGERKSEILADLPQVKTIPDKDFPNALKQVKAGKLDIDYLLETYSLTEAQQKLLKDATAI